MAEAVLVGLLVGLGVLLGPGRSRPAGASAGAPDASVAGRDGGEGLLRRGRILWALLAGGGAAVVLGGPLALPAGIVAGVVVAMTAGRLEPRTVRRRREEVRRDLPHVVTLLAAALRSGQAPVEAIELVCRALPGAASERLAPVAARLRLGGDAEAIWGRLADDPDLAPLGRALGRAHRTGSPVVAAVEGLAAELGVRARAEVEDRARAVGVRAAVPLGVCLLPSFLLLGIVPLAVSLAAGIVR
ncbi:MULTISPECIES: type II secretion system F family protein [unclassified Nocardioides]|uniref:type II secretion system F family protein n=1 Tax=unclassified Nocardioides TaxID=2615069 RepID=UPI00114F3758|nr:MULTISPECIES: type II secretion system F family protein [unclassified Nocardioides]TQK68297.1 type II secretion system (T2SS) protein F [Nocardioides sp. SLBN-35]WGY02385.1 type II secretion system F family protein [Nocardioides sp. QY071]